MIKTLLPAVEPFQKAASGFGFLGCIMYDDELDKVQCHKCGKWLCLLTGTHLAKHRMTADDYRQEFGLTFNYPLCGYGLSRRRSKLVTRKFLAAGTAMRRKLAGKQPFNRPARHVGLRTESQRNKYGTCERQLRARYDQLKLDIGRAPSTYDFRNNGNRALLEAITRRHGTLNAYRELVGDPVLTKADQNRLRAAARR